MSTESGKRQRKRSTRTRRTDRGASTTTATSDSEPMLHASRSTPHGSRTSSDLAAREHYRREKARRAGQVRAPEHPLEQARRAYHALLAADADRAKGGRPKKNVATPKKPTLPEQTDADRED